ncbi:MAG TPA: hypothetical protein VHT75_12695 [Acidimicrobiales bacterium]|nr:hypothetical protein [Acidimicrobiales bacterium]
MAVTPPYSDGSGDTYVMTASVGPFVAPNRGAPSGGMTAGAVLGSARGITTTIGSTTSGGIGIAQLDADIHVLIPVFGASDTYRGVLTITTI